MWLLTISSYWFCLKGALAQPLNSARGPRATHIYLPANPVERSFAFQSIHKNTTRLWSWKSVHSSPATFKVAFKEDKHHGLPSHRNTGVFRARRSHQRCSSPAQVGETQQDVQANQRCQPKAGGQPHQGSPDSRPHLVAMQWSPRKAKTRVRQGPTETLAGRSREQPSALHWTRSKGKKKTCPQITNQISSQSGQKPLHFTGCEGHDSYQEKEAAREPAAVPSISLASALWVAKAAVPQRCANTRFKWKA